MFALLLIADAKRIRPSRHPRLKEGDVCYQFTEDGSKPMVNRKRDCPRGTHCKSDGSVGFDSTMTCQERSSEVTIEPWLKKRKPRGIQVTIEPWMIRLKEGDVCFQFTEDSSKPMVDLKKNCPRGTRCKSDGMLGFNTKMTCQRTGGEVTIEPSVGKVCCTAETARCLACMGDTTVEEVCEEEPEIDGCDKLGAKEPKGKVCCEAQTARCLACMGDTTVGEVCKVDPEIDGCDELGAKEPEACCTAMTKTCRRCQCKQDPSLPQCAKRKATKKKRHHKKKPEHFWTSF